MRFFRSVNGRTLPIACMIVVGLVFGLAGHATAKRMKGTDRIDRAVSTLKTSKHEKTRVSAALVLAGSADKRSVKPLVKALFDESKVVRAIAAKALGELGDPRALPALRRSSKDKDQTVRRRVTEAIAKIRRSNSETASKRNTRVRSRKSLTNYQISARERPLIKSAKPKMYIVLKSSADRSKIRIKKTTRKKHAALLRKQLLRRLGKDAKITLSGTEAKDLKLSSYSLDVTIEKFDRKINGVYTEIACELRVALSDERGKMISLLTGGAKVQVPKRTFRSEYEPQLRLEALDGAVKSVYKDVVAFLVRQS